MLRPILVALAIALLDLGHLVAQTGAQPYQGYTAPDSFLIGGYELNRVWLLRLADSIGLDVAATYQGSTDFNDSIFNSSVDTAIVLPRSLYGYNDTATRMSIMFEPVIFHRLVQGSPVIENYPEHDNDALQAMGFQTVGGTARDSSFFRSHFVKGVILYTNAADSPGTHRVIADRPTYTKHAIRRPDVGLYESLSTGRVPHSLESITTDSLYTMLAALLPGYVDSSRFCYLSIAMKVPDSLSGNPDDVIAHVTVFRRDTLQQIAYDTSDHTTCLCNLFVPYVKFTVTVGDYTAQQHDAGGGFREFGRYFDLVWKNEGGRLHYIAPFASVAGDGKGAGVAPYYCDSLLARRQRIANTDSLLYLPPDAELLASPPEASDLMYRVESANRMPVSLLRGQLSSHLYKALRAGTFDTLIHREEIRLRTDSTLGRHFQAFGISDEPWTPDHRAFGVVSRTFQRFNHLADSNDRRNVFCPVYTNYDGLRVFSEDFDSTSVKTVQAMVSDRYLAFADAALDPISVRYANPDSMSSQATDTMYRMGLSDTSGTRRRLIAGNSPSDYAFFTQATQARFGNSNDRHTESTAAGLGGLWLPNLARCVDVAKFRYRDRGPATPVYTLLDVHGWLPWDKDAGYVRAFNKRPPTPEEIIAHGWLSVNCAVDGVLFSCMTYSGVQMGPLRLDREPPLSPFAEEYDTARIYKADLRNIWKHYYDRTWVGFRSRMEAIVETTSMLRMLDSLVGVRTLEFRQEQVSVHATHFAENCVPMVARLRSERPRLDTLPYTPCASRQYDSAAQTFFELTHFRPRRADTASTRDDSRYLVITNRRLYPIDYSTYSGATTDLFESVSDNPLDTFSTVGLGHIDVRRPVLWLRNSTSTLADSFVVEKVDTGTWRRTVALGDSVELDWLAPGHGAMYRVTPVAKTVSPFGVAYNNSVHAIEADLRGLHSTAGGGFPVAVYERDSAIYKRMMDADSVWSGETLLSPPSDTTTADLGIGVVRAGSNFHPAISITKAHGVDGGGVASLVVWERRDVLSGAASVEGMFRPVGDSIYQHIVFRNYASLPSGFLLAPAVVGLDSGFAVAWASPQPKGIQLVYVRESTSAVSDSVVDAASVAEIGRTIDSTCQFPSVAFNDLEKPSFSGYKAVHLAYQQGPIGGATRIMYHQVGIDMATGDVLVSGVPKYATEEVTKGLQACAFRMPSIAADRARVGVAFEIVGEATTIGLRFRDSLNDPIVGGGVGAWATPIYKWGGYDKHTTRTIAVGVSRRYENPSLTEFWSMDSASVVSQPFGALSWQWTNVASTRRNGTCVYRFGDSAAAQVDDGGYPSMVYAPFVNEKPYSHTGLFLRGSLSQKTQQSSDVGRLSDYYPARAENGLSDRAELFAKSVVSRGIFSGFKMLSATALAATPGCVQTWPNLTAGLVTPAGKFPVLSSTSPMPTTPPMFLQTPGSGTTVVDSLSTVVNVSRTSDFVVGTDPVEIRRVVSGSDSLVSWLDANYDSVNSRQADVEIVTELIRASNSAVIWTGDTVSARTIGAGTVDELVVVPVDSLVDSGGVVYVRIRPVPSPSLSYEVSGEFQFVCDSTLGTLFPRVRAPRRSQPLEADRTLKLDVQPNPAHEQITVRLIEATAGEGEGLLFDLVGHVMRRTTFKVGALGETRVVFDVNGLPSGSYTLHVRAGSRTADAVVTILN
jgi:hypothetical protein